MIEDPFLCIGITTSSVKRNNIIRNFLPKNDSRYIHRFLLGDNQKSNFYDELLVPIASDHRPNDKHISCIQKVRWWYSYALEKWPNAKYFAKTEDDTYVEINKLIFDLKYLDSTSRVVYGLIDFIGENNQFLGDIEHGGYPRSRTQVHPFPTGPLAVFSKSLATDMFTNCNYIKPFPNTSKGKRCFVVGKHMLQGKSCDGILGMLMGNCVRKNITLDDKRTSLCATRWWYGMDFTRTRICCCTLD